MFPVRGGCGLIGLTSYLDRSARYHAVPYDSLVSTRQEDKKKHTRRVTRILVRRYESIWPFACYWCFKNFVSVFVWHWIDPESVEAHATRAIENSDSEKQGGQHSMRKSAMRTFHTRAIFLNAILPTLV